MHANQNWNNPANHSQPSKLFRNRRLDRPGDLKLMQLLTTAHPNDKIKLLNGTIMIPIPPEDAKALGLRAPDSDNASLKSSSASSRSSARLSVSKYVRKRPSDNSKTKRDIKRQRNADAKSARKLLDLKEEQKAQGVAALGTLSNLQTKLERGLKSISNRSKARAKGRLDTKKELDISAGLNPSGFRSPRRSSINGKPRRNSLPSEEGKVGKAKKESKSTKQLFSTTESWSNDSVVSHSDNCACCHSREPCPFHGSESYDGK